jgi:hypothetical protein
MATIEDFQKLDIRVGRVLEAAPLEGARSPSAENRLCPELACASQAPYCRGIPPNRSRPLVQAVVIFRRGAWPVFQ